MLERESIRSGVSFLLLIAGAAASLATSYSDPEVDADGAVSGRVGGTTPVTVWRLDVALNEEAAAGSGFDGGVAEVRATGSGGGRWGGIEMWVLPDPAIADPYVASSPTTYTGLRLECADDAPCNRTLYVVVERRTPGTGEVRVDVTAHGVVTYRGADDAPGGASMDLDFTEVPEVATASGRLEPKVVRPPKGRFGPLAVYDATVTVDAPATTDVGFLGYLAAVTRGRAKGSIDVFRDEAFGSDTFLQSGGIEYFPFHGSDCASVTPCTVRFRIEIDTNRRMRWWPEALVLFPEGDVPTDAEVTIELLRVRF